MKNNSKATYEVVKVVTNSHRVKSSELFSDRANAIRKNVTDKRNFMQQKGTGQDLHAKESVNNPEQSSEKNQNVVKLAWDEVHTQDECEIYIK